MTTRPTDRRRGGIPRGVARTGPVLFSYGFRPFFLGGGLWAVVAMALWLAALSGAATPGGRYGAAHWHMHEMLFGFTSAVLTGYLMMSVPNWTGRLPVSGRPLMALFLLWAAGRLVMIVPPGGNPAAAVFIEGLFLPVVAAVFLVEIVAVRKWREGKVVGLVAVIAAANLVFHWNVLAGADTGIAARASVAAFATLVLIVGGRLTPAATRSWVNRRGGKRFPAPHDRFDTATIALSAVALAVWVAFPYGRLTVAAALIAATLNILRLARWRGWATLAEPLVLALHGMFALFCLGLIACALAAAGLIGLGAALHVLAIGAIGGGMLAVTNRVIRTQTAAPMRASLVTSLSYACLATAALLRPFAEVVGSDMGVRASGFAWIAAWSLFCAEHARTLVSRRRWPAEDRAT